jgi:hypothetical protein
MVVNSVIGGKCEAVSLIVGIALQHENLLCNKEQSFSSPVSIANKDIWFSDIPQMVSA